MLICRKFFRGATDSNESSINSDTFKPFISKFEEWNVYIRVWDAQSFQNKKEINQFLQQVLLLMNFKHGISHTCMKSEHFSTLTPLPSRDKGYRLQFIRVKAELEEELLFSPCYCFGFDWEFNDVGTRPEMQFALFITLSIWHIKVFNSLQQKKKEKPVFI